MALTTPIDAHNKFGVKAHNNGEHLALLMIEKAESMTREDALNLAAWLFLEAGGDFTEFQEVVWQVRAHQKMQEASFD
jgi:hypothetical protein